jgi:transcriptional regulator with GAF, ATPase, and Fis domain
VERVGCSWSIPVDVRVIAATNCNLSHSVESGEFRLDLFYRLNVFAMRKQLSLRGTFVMASRHSG